MKITKNFLVKKGGCTEGIYYYDSIKITNLNKIIQRLISDEKLDWANWILTRSFDKKQNVKYAIFAAMQVIEIYEKKYPNDNRPRQAINAAKKYLKNPSKGNKNAAADAAAYAAEAAYAAYAAAAAAADAAAYAAVKNEMKIKILQYGLGLL